jgi:hypothetical protein
MPVDEAGVGLAYLQSGAGCNWYPSLLVDLLVWYYHTIFDISDRVRPSDVIDRVVR